MKYRRFGIGATLGLTVALVSGGFFYLQAGQEGPRSQSSDSVAKPKKPPTDTPQEQEKPQIPSEFKKQKETPPDTPTFQSNATTVNVDVSVLDDKNRFIPRIPQNNFRVLEDGVPQQISQFGQGEAPMTICMLIEFSGTVPGVLVPGLVRNPSGFLWFFADTKAGRQCRSCRL